MLLECRAWSDAEVAADYARGVAAPQVSSDSRLIVLPEESRASYRVAAYVLEGRSLEAGAYSSQGVSILEVGTAGLRAGQKVLVSTADQSPNYFEAATIQSVDSAGQLTLERRLTNEAQYTVSAGAYISRQLVSDHQMEDGGLGSWEAVGAPDVLEKSTLEVWSGQQSLHVVGSTAGVGFGQSVLGLAEGEEYWLEAVYYIVSGGFILDVRLGDGTGEVSLPGFPYALGTVGSWERWEQAVSLVDYAGALAGPGDRVRLEFTVPGTAEGYVDRLSLRQNLVQNGGFEGAYAAGVASGWSVAGDIFAAEETVDFHRGQKAQRVGAGDGNTRYVFQEVGLVYGRVYQLVAWMKLASGTGRVHLAVSGAAQADLGSASGSWERLCFWFVAQGESLRLKLFADAGCEGLVDDVALLELHPAEGAGYPDFPSVAVQYNYQEELVFEEVAVTTYPNGLEQRVGGVAVPRMRFRLSFPVLTSAEVEELWQFYQARQGVLLPFYFTSPRTGQRYLVRFQQTSFSREMFAYLLESCGLDLIEVHGEEV